MYSSKNKIVLKLTTVKSVTVTDDIFLKIFLVYAIVCHELRSGSKKFLQKGVGTYSDILENIYTD